MSFVLLLLIVAEIITSLFICLGIYELWIVSLPKYGLYGLIVGSSTLLCFLFGQRLAKDYDGARGIAIYFIICMIGLFIISFRS
ncbi:MAG: hypothetical protein Q4C98_02055 [Capnocytophaga sp.]|nr:hypothetical protein [Capnocytophaga sp.]